MYAKTAIIAALASVAAAQDVTTPAGNVTVVTTTRVVSEYTTYCPAPTTFHFNGKQYEVTEATTLTITDCPCTVVEPCTETNPPVGPTEVPHPPPVVPTEVPHPPPAGTTKVPPPVGPVSPPPAPPAPPATGTVPPVAPPAVTPAVPTTTPAVGSGIESFQVSLGFAAAAAAVAGYFAL